MLHFGIFGTFTGHSISLGVDNGTPDGGLYAQLMMKKHLTNINILHTSFKTRSVIDFNHIDKSLKKQLMNYIIIPILNLKASFGKKSPHDVQKTKSIMQFVIVLLIVSGTIAGRVSTNLFVLGILPCSCLILKTY